MPPSKLKDFSGLSSPTGAWYSEYTWYKEGVFNPSYVIKNTIKIFGNITSGFKTPSL